ncbi:TetR family transcriptional regulator [Amycolatopsis sp. CA-128772]|uniref:TetR family transcriptional regulator n=1 Tax=Amycolatopsis sp. CA-128772 TaxID=2073159 RepID=UPI000CD2A496|nr:TetR family transcriptional regulator [Amycolatopsis sp. CA-128772]
MSAGFQRARRPEQIEARRTAILAAARELLAQRPVAEISLRELSCRVGLAKSNVLRYFDSREAVFLEVLDGLWTAWLDELEQALGPAPPGPDGVAGTIASTLAGRRVLCELISVTAPVLERNIPADLARGFRRRAAANTERLGELVRARVPELPPPAARHFARDVLVLVAGSWPAANPAPAVAALGEPPAFAAGLAESLTNLLAGLLARQG